MPDTIGTHLAEVMRLSVTSIVHANRSAIRLGEGDHGASYRESLWAAEDKGAAAGHAFRAAELAYDMGQREGRSREMRREEAELRDYAEMAVHWNGEE